VKKILFLGPKSPPVTGYSNIVTALSQCLTKEGSSVMYISTVPSILAHLFPNASWKISRLIFLFLLFPFVILLMPFNSILYLNINGGFGQLFDCLFSLVGRVFGKGIVLHHNSYGYINQRKWLAQLLFFIAGRKAKHVVNCEDMKRKLVSRYKCVNNVHLVSNVSILTMRDPDCFDFSTRIASELDSTINKDILTLGFMGYFNHEKGVDTFSNVVKQLDDYETDRVKGIAVGPIYDKDLVENLKHEYGKLIEFSPPVFGEKRDDFFNEIDVLLFPSRYLNEAEPLTIHHALSAGVPVISTDIGCLNEILNRFPDSYSFSIDNYLSGSKEVINKMLSKNYAERVALRVELKSSYDTYSKENVKNFKITLARLGVI